MSAYFPDGRRRSRSELDVLIRERGGCLALKYARSTSTLVGLYLAEEAGMDPEAGKYSTVCEDHGCLVNHETRDLADSHLSHPEEWCAACMAIQNNKVEF